MGKILKNKELAARLGLSGTLVSLVLNNKADQHGIKKETQEKVLAFARKMGYFDSFSDGEKLFPVEDKPGIIGFIVPAINDPFVVQISQYLQNAFTDIGLGFSVVTKDPDDLRYDRLIATFKKFFSGIILLGDASDDDTIRKLRSASYPFVLIEKSATNLRLNTVCTDFVTGANLVVNHIDNFKYKNFIIATLKSDNTKLKDLTDAMLLNPSIKNPAVIELEKHRAEDEIDFIQFESFLRPPYRADVMIIMNADLVYPIMSMLRKKKLRVPQDIAVISMEEGIGFDLMFSPVTCLRKPLSGLAVKTANMIWSEIKNSGKGKFKRQVSLSPELIIRNSCGAL